MNIDRITKYASLLASVVLIVALSACDTLISFLPDADDETVSHESPVPQLLGLSGEIQIGVVVSETGAFGDSYGAPMMHGFELARKEINAGQIGDARITFITEDDRGTVEGAVAAFDKLISQDKVSAILGPTLSRQARAVFPTSQKNQVVALAAISAASGLSAIGDYNFRINLPNDVLYPSGVSATKERIGYRQVATIYDASDLYGLDSDARLQEALRDNGVKILSSQTFQTGDPDISKQFEVIAKLNPDAVFVSALNADMPQIIIQGRAFVSESVPFIIPDITLTEVQAAGAAAEGVVTFTGWSEHADTPNNAAFVETYQSAYGSAPTNWAAQSYTAVYLLASAIADAQSTDPTAIRDAMASIENRDTILGKFSYDLNGDAVYDPLVLIVENGQLEISEGVDGIDATTHVINDFHVTDVTLAVAEIFPPQVFLHVDGYLPDSCTEIHQTTERREGNTFYIQITTKRPRDMACATVITEIQHVVGLGSFDPGMYRAIVNGVSVDFEIP